MLAQGNSIYSPYISNFLKLGNLQLQDAFKGGFTHPVSSISHLRADGDGAEKDEGELTGGKRLIRRLRKEFGHFADVIVADALYLNAPFINTVLECGMDVVIRLKDETRLIFQDAETLLERGEGQKKGFQKGHTKIDVCDLSGFEMGNVEPTM